MKPAHGFGLLIPASTNDDLTPTTAGVDWDVTVYEEGELMIDEDNAKESAQEVYVPMDTRPDAARLIRWWAERAFRAEDMLRARTPQPTPSEIWTVGQVSKLRKVGSREVISPLEQTSSKISEDEFVNLRKEKFVYHVKKEMLLTLDPADVLVDWEDADEGLGRGAKILALRWECQMLAKICIPGEEVRLTEIPGRYPPKDSIEMIVRESGRGRLEATVDVPLVGYSPSQKAWIYDAAWSSAPSEEKPEPK